MSMYHVYDGFNVNFRVSLLLSEVCLYIGCLCALSSIILFEESSSNVDALEYVAGHCPEPEGKHSLVVNPNSLQFTAKLPTLTERSFGASYDAQPSWAPSTQPCSCHFGNSENTSCKWWSAAASTFKVRHSRWFEPFNLLKFSGTGQVEHDKWSF